MKLYIAEKPSLGRAVAEVLPKPHKKEDGYITLANGDVVSWCIGHLLEQAEPESYDPEFKRWQIRHLPIVPTQWKLEVKSKTRAQYRVLKKLIKQADHLVNVGDPDREGQLLIDEVISFAGASKTKIKTAERCLVNDLNPGAVKKSLANLRSNREFVPLATSALARSRADWLYGINMTRLCTVLGQSAGYRGVLSVGRVQTPVLGLVVRRDLEIENFKPKPYYVLEASLTTEDGFTFKGIWKPGTAHADHLDEEDRVLSRPLVEKVAQKVHGKKGTIKRYSAQIKSQAPPLPYSLSSLQIDAARRYGLSAKVVLDICQSLYERHKVITYPRSDCRHLPKSMLADVNTVLDRSLETAPTFAHLNKSLNRKQKTRAWDDSKVTAHHAIIPTGRTYAQEKLNATERQIFELVTRQYLIQFLPDFKYRQIEIDSIIVDELFITRQREVVSVGWKIAFDTESKPESDPAKAAPLFPNLSQSDSLVCTQTDIQDKETSPPKRFTDATLLSAMTSISRYVDNTEIRKILRETDGLGTEATRAGIIELLFKREYLTRVRKEIHSTEIGRQLILKLPEAISLPDMTAQWEAQLRAISQREMSYPDFLNPMISTLDQMVSNIAALKFESLAGLGTKAKFKRPYKAKAKARSKSQSKAKTKTKPGIRRKKSTTPKAKRQPGKK